MHVQDLHGWWEGNDLIKYANWPLKGLLYYLSTIKHKLANDYLAYASFYYYLEM